MERSFIGDLELLGQETLLRVVMSTEQPDTTLSVEGAEAAILYMQTWVAWQKRRSRTKTPEQSMDELRALVGRYFDGVDAEAYVSSLRKEE